jgi:hypothetical protein
MPTNVDVVVWNGSKWRRYPDARQPNRRRYYQGYLEGRLTSLHRAKWEKANGAIPNGHDVHHKDGNPLNNRLSNLQLLTVAEHRRLEGERGSHSTPKAIVHLASIRSKAAEWHRSPAGREWHREHAEHSLRTIPYRDCVCRSCGEPFRARNPRAAYCSSKCYQRDNKREAKLPAVCGWCAKSFKAAKRTRRFCSYSCSSFARHAARRARLQSEGGGGS